jgi:LysM repeat protein
VLVRRLLLIVMLLAAGPVGLAACGGGDAASDGTLPPIIGTTTTTTSTTTTTIYVPVTYTIEPGDGLFVIADKFGVDPDTLMNLNGIDDPDRIEAGDVLLIPQATIPATTVAG